MIGRPILRFDAVTSTQDLAFAMAEQGAPEGTTIVTRYQSGGRGRAGRRWETAPGEALMFSLLLRPHLAVDRLMPLSILVADAIADTLATSHHLSPSIKWPNDVVLDGKKVSGVLIQMRGGVVAVGIGANLDGVPPALRDVATSIRDETGISPDPDVVLHDLLDGIGRRYGSLLRGDTDADIAVINRRLWMQGCYVAVQDGDRQHRGTIRGVRADGALMLGTPDGPRAIHSGEVTRGPRAVTP